MKITATVENTVFRNEDNGYSVVSLTYNHKRLTAVGNLPEVYEGQTLELEGDFVVNKKFGEQFKVEECKVVEPTTFWGKQKEKNIVQRCITICGCHVCLFLWRHYLFFCFCFRL